MAKSLKSHKTLAQLTAAARDCRLCEHKLPLGAKPIIQTHSQAKILIVSQAPGSIAHASGVPFMDKSGERLRDWMGISVDDFYNPQNIAIVPMGFCYPGKAKSGDVPPLIECAQTWQAQFEAFLPNIKLRLLIGLHAQKWHLGSACKDTLTQTVQNWKTYYETADLPMPNIPMPHPSPRNNIWLAKNAWFEQDLVPTLRIKVKQAIA